MLPWSKDKIHEVPFNSVVSGNAAYPLSTFEIFLRSEFAIENLLFYREVEALKRKEKEVEKGKFFDETGSLSKEAEAIVKKYIQNEAEYEINVGGLVRERVFESLKQSKEENIPLRSETFQDAQNEVYALLYSDKYPRFLEVLQETNLSDKLSSEAVGFGTNLFVIGTFIFIIFWAIQFYAAGQLEERDSRALEVLNDRKWRVAGFPFLYAGVGFILAGNSHLCTICSTLGWNYKFDDDTPKYSRLISDLLVSKTLHLLRIRHTLPERLEDCKICVDQIEKANRIKGLKNAFYNLLICFVLFTLLLMLPPDNPEWFG